MLSLNSLEKFCTYNSGGGFSDDDSWDDGSIMSEKKEKIKIKSIKNGNNLNVKP